MKTIPKISELFLLLGFITTIFSCSYDPDPELEEIPEDTHVDSIFSSNRANQKPLNLVYFIPTDFVSEFKTNIDTITARTSEAMLYAQKWYKKQMELAGYSDKTFALYTRYSNTQLRLIPVYGTKASDMYQSNKEVRAEVATFLESNPDLVGGKHTMILCDYATGFANNANNRMGIAKSPDHFNMVSTGKNIDGLELLTSEQFATLLHELGHALNAPHVAHNASMLPERSLMGGGGTNRWKASQPEVVRLVSSTAAIFDVSEAFNKTPGVDYYTEKPEVHLTGYTIEKDSSIQATKATFVFTSDIPAKYLYIGMDAAPYGSNSNYDMVSFSTAVSPTSNPNEYTASLVMPYSDFFNNYEYRGTKVDNPIELSVNILTENGFRETPLSYTFTISSVNQPEPDDNINKKLRPLSDRSLWTITANSTSHGQPIDQGADKMLDGDLSSFWFSDWPTASASATPHIVNVDMGAENTFIGIYLNSQIQFRPKHVLVEVSSDQSNYNQVADFNRELNNQEVEVFFDTPQTARYVRITIDEVYTKNGVENLGISELDIIIE